MIDNLKKIDSTKINNQKFIINNKSSMVFGFENNNKTYFFKAKSKHTYIHNEIMCNILGLKLGLTNIKMIESVFVDNQGKRNPGIVSEDYVKDRTNKETMNLNSILNFLNNTTEISEVSFDTDRSIHNLLNILIDLKKHNSLFTKMKFKIDSSIKSDLIKHAIYFFITGQSDFNNSNLEFILEKSKNTQKISLAPFIDNSISFFQNVNFAPPITKIKNQPESIILSKRPFLTLRYESALHKQNETFLKDIAKAIIFNEDISTFYKQVKSIDIKKLLLEEKTKHNHFSLTPEKIELAELYFNTSIKIIDDSMHLLREDVKRKKRMQKIKSGLIEFGF